MGAGPLVFLSTQLTPMHEAKAMREEILPGFGEPVRFMPEDVRMFAARLGGDVKVDKPDLVGGIRGDLVDLCEMGRLENMEPVMAGLKDRAFTGQFKKMAMISKSGQAFVPWMHATYIMVADKKALESLPPGADVMDLSYGQFLEWAANLHQAAGKPMLGFPAGKLGLMHRFLQGYLYPSFTGAGVGKFDSPQARSMWRYAKKLWSHVSARSVAFDNLSGPLCSGEILVAWDHTARLIDAFMRYPGRFIAFPAPRGPEGRGYITVLAGLSIPRRTTQPGRAARLIEYLTRPDVQSRMPSQVGFFPVVDVDLSEGPLVQLAEAVHLQVLAPGGIPGVLPEGLGKLSTSFNTAYMAAFSRIVLRDRPVDGVLDKQAATIRDILTRCEAACWLPDTSREVPCPVD